MATDCPKSYYCCLPLCPDRYKDQKNLITFPTKRTRQLEWIAILNMPQLLNLSPRTVAKYKMCLTHFEPKYWNTSRGNKSVTWNAVPSLSINLGPKTIEIDPGETHFEASTLNSTVTVTDIPIDSSLKFLEEVQLVLEGCESACKICRNVISELSRHVRLTHSTSRTLNFNCDICDKSFSTSLYLQIHIDSHSQLPSIPMETCIPYSVHYSRSTEITKDDRSSDLIGTVIDDSLKCEPSDMDPLYIPPKDSVSNLDLDIKPNIISDHLYSKVDKLIRKKRSIVPRKRRNKKISQKQFKCEHCDKIFLKAQSLKNHALIHDDQKSGECSICKTEFSDQKDLTEHLLSTHKDVLDSLYICKICDIGFSKIIKLDQHFEQIHRDRMPYACKNCDKIFFDESKLKNHSMIHNEENSFICEYCSRGCKSLTYLEKHLRVHSKVKPYKCTNCSSSYNVEENLRKHEKVHNDVKSFNCEQCDRSYKSEYQLSVHVKSHQVQEISDRTNKDTEVVPPNEKYVACGICKSEFVSTLLLTKHIRTRHNGASSQELNICKFCGKQFIGGVRKLTTHILKYHPTEKPHSCKICHREFSRSQDMLDHYRLHTGEKPFTCPHCPRTFRTRKSRHPHLRVHSGEKPYECDVCSKSYRVKFQLNVHKRREHTEERPFSCDHCDKSYASKACLKTHLQTHGVEDGEHNFTCQDCGKSYAYKHYLEIHIRTHTGEKPFMCEECGKCFSSKTSLIVHRRIHAKEKPYKCNECGKTLSSKSTFEAHTKLHTGDRAHVCEICGKSSTTLSRLNQHINIHTGERKHCCVHCGKCFLELHHLKQHINCVHVKKSK